MSSETLAASTPSKMALPEFVELARRYVERNLPPALLADATHLVASDAKPGARGAVITALCKQQPQWHPLSADLRRFARRARECLERPAQRDPSMRVLAAALAAGAPLRSESVSEASARVMVAAAAARFREHACAALLTRMIRPNRAYAAPKAGALAALVEQSAELEHGDVLAFVSDSGALILSICHDLFVWHVRGGPSLFAPTAPTPTREDLPRALAVVADRIDAQLDELARHRLSMSDHVWGALAVLALRELSGGGDWSEDPWEGLAVDRAGEVPVSWLARLVGSAGYTSADGRVQRMCAGSRVLAAIAQPREPLPSPSVGASVAAEIARLQAFVEWLFGNEAADWSAQGAPHEPFDIGAIGRRAVAAWDLLDSPVLRADKPGALQETLRIALVQQEERLFHGSAAPRPRIVDESLILAAKRTLVVDGERWLSSPRCLALAALCHEMLLGLRARAELAQAEEELAQAPTKLHEAAEQRVQAAKALAASAQSSFERWLRLARSGAASAADMWAVHVLLRACARAVAGRVSASSKDLFAGADARCREELLLLAALSPIAQLLDARLWKELEGVPPNARDELRAWQSLETLLDAPDAGPLHRMVVARWLRRAAQAPQSELLRELRQCLEARTLGGPLLVARFFAEHARLVLGAPEFSDRLRQLRSAAALATDGAGTQELQHALATFRNWYWCLGSESAMPQQVRAMWIELARTAGRCRTEVPADDPRWPAFDHAWGAILSTALDGLGAREWRRDVVYLLQAFWLDLCRAALEGQCPAVLDLATPHATDVEELAAQNFARLETLRLARARRAAHRRHLARGGAEPADPGEGEPEERADFEHIGVLLELAKKHGTPLAKALIVRRLLVRDAGAASTWKTDNTRLAAYLESGSHDHR